LSSPAPEQLRRWLETMRQCLIDRPYQPQLGGAPEAHPAISGHGGLQGTAFASDRIEMGLTHMVESAVDDATSTLASSRYNASVGSGCRGAVGGDPENKQAT
jgi:hypothetical protein